MASKLRQIKKAFEYVQYLEAQGVPYQSTNSDEVRICCPICCENEYKLYINDVKKACICFKCEFGFKGQGDVFNLIAAIEGIPVNVAIARTIANYREITPDDFMFEEEDEILPQDTINNTFLSARRVELPSCAVPISKDDPETLPGLAYLLERGFTEKDIEITRAHYVTFGSVEKDGKRLDISRRVLFPIWGGDNYLVSWLARSVVPNLPKNKPKYFNCPHSDLAMTFWPFLRPGPGVTEAVLVEGLIDALSVRKAGVCAYSSFGKKLSKEQISFLKDCGFSSITIFYDRGAEKESFSIAKNLQLQFDNVYVVDNLDWPEGQDSGSLLKDPNGIEIIQKALTNKVNINNDIEVTKWFAKKMVV